MLCIALLTVLCSWTAVPALAQTAEPSRPAIRRWLDVQNVHLWSRFRWTESNTGRITSSTVQWQPNVRARVLLDPAARYAIHVGALGGTQFVSGWNNSGAGLGTFSGAFTVRQLFVAAEPLRGLELQVGGLYLARGENTEITSYDNDGFIVGERVTLRREHGPLSQVVATVGRLGDLRTPNVFDRLDGLDDVNYAQLLFGIRLGRQVNLSADYTYEDGRDIFREGVAVRAPAAALPLTAVRFDAYQRKSDASGSGFNAASEFRVAALTVTAGVAHVDQHYLIPGYQSPNADRFERGTRFYSQGTYALTRDVSVGWFHGEAFNVDYNIPNEHRFEILLTLNPTATLKAKGIF